MSWALPGLLAALPSDGCVMAAKAAKFWTVIGGKRPAAAAAAVAAAESALPVWAPKPKRTDNIYYILAARWRYSLLYLP